MFSLSLLFNERPLHLRSAPRLNQHLLLFFLFLALPCGLLAQVNGTVFDADGYPLSGATVQWVGGGGTTVDAEGGFVLPAEAGRDRFTISYLGFADREFRVDTLQLPLQVVLEEAGTDLGEIQVTARDNGRAASLLSTHNIESVSSKELRKAPCCSLAESFENSPVVDLTYGDPLTGRREIQVLGLRGNYTQLTLEKRPMLDGLASPFALDLIPGPWVSGIQIGKGSGSLESGAQGMTGEINTELVKPTAGPGLYLNVFAGSQGRSEANVLANRQVGKSLWAGAALHGSFTENAHDFDSDGFKDMPDRRTAVGLFRLFRVGEGNWEGQWNVLGARERRSGGQQRVHDHGQPNLNPYTIEQDNQRLEVWGKTGYFGFQKPHQSIGVIYSGSYHKLNNLYGRKIHQGEQRSVYLNALYHTQMGNDQHQLSLGGTARMDDFAETFAGRDFSRNENTLGAYGEYTFRWEESREGADFRAFTAVLGLRADRHNLGGMQYSPRANLKYQPNEHSALRLSAGRGWRSPNLLVDNLNWLPSSREIVVGDPEVPPTANPGFLGLETAWNFGFNFTQDFHLAGREGQLVFDAFRTVFQQQIIVDAEQDFTTLRLYQLEGPSRANSLMLSTTYEILPLIDVKLAYKYTDVQQTYALQGLRELPLTARQRVLATVGYDGPRFKAHLNYQLVGEQRLIDFDGLPSSVFLDHPQRAPAFGLLAAQLTYVANAKTEFYVGGENLTNRQQRNAIIGAYEPFDGEYFDATQVYQPLFGTMLFAGVRWTLSE
ncbi:TonB-dependent receptor [Neolewinella lacunae]|uniref:TonB-dependent receptor n=1 Tax=Neolewinella lacunae TaxID=1517758 RepID=A0A923PLY8_9BACT|nr:TonB-dependent receptor [Neolewinella lacunae]MBC6993724.1 TonB-dependent receptor [Neolewinella lacunae]MDN3635750.1 TonB-dependent receptor [Neolewinella lacunae]